MAWSRRQVLRTGGAWAAACAAARVFAGSADTAAEQVVVTPEETDELLANPGMGWQTFHEFANHDRNLAGLPSSLAYFRFYWNEIESDDGKIDFPMFDDLLAKAHQAGQQLAFRVMCVGGGAPMAVPAYLKASGCKGAEYRSDGTGQAHWSPDMDDPIFQKAHFRLIDELAKRYAAHPDFGLLDIGSVGLWGEWHMSGTNIALPTPETRRKIIEKWCAAFPDTPKMMLIGDVDGMKRAFELGAGWRADCIGDLGGFSKNWNHMENIYPQALEKSAAADIWQKAPVAFESCWDMRKWVEEKWDIRRIFDFALEKHASCLNNKSAPIPEGTRPEIERFLKKLGYRLVPRRIEHPAAVAAGATLNLKLTLENIGVAPPYRHYKLAIRLTDEAGKERILADKTSVKGLLPGVHELAVKVELPRDVSAGKHSLSIGIVDPRTSAPAIRLAIKGRDAAGWYPVSSVSAV